MCILSACVQAAIIKCQEDERMEIITCSVCGKLFNYIRGVRVCPACQKRLEDKFMEVKKYVREHPDVDVRTLSEEMEVSVNQINRWVRE